MSLRSLPVTQINAQLRRRRSGACVQHPHPKLAAGVQKLLFQFPGVRLDFSILSCNLLLSGESGPKAFTLD